MEVKGKRKKKVSRHFRYMNMQIIVITYNIFILIKYKSKKINEDAKKEKQEGNIKY